jgi:hypothetical protein
LSDKSDLRFGEKIDVIGLDEEKKVLAMKR